jgi:hypothetical protein
MPSSNTSTKLVQDANGQWIPVTETNQRTPGAGIKPVDPLGAKQNPSGATSGGVTDKPKSSGVTGSKSKPVTPTAPKGGGAGNVHVGEPLFQGKTTSISKAQNDVMDATKLSSLADQVATKPDDAINQKRLAVSLEKMSAGRFTTQALDYVIKSGWGNTLEQWANNPSTGALPKDVVRQLVDGAHENLKASQAALKEAMTPVGSASDTTPKATGARPKGAIGTVTHGNKNYWVDAEGKNLGVAP